MRPNSPPAQTTVLSRRPRCFKSSSSVATPRSIEEAPADRGPVPARTAAVGLERLLSWAAGVTLAFALLAFIGVKMILETIRESREEREAKAKQACAGREPKDPFCTKTLFIMAIATSIDALAVGITFALTDENIWVSSCTIGVVTFVISTLGVLLGNSVGVVLKKSAGIIGGAILIGIGLKILIEHLAGG